MMRPLKPKINWNLVLKHESSTPLVFSQAVLSLLMEINDFLLHCLEQGIEAHEDG